MKQSIIINDIEYGIDTRSSLIIQKIDSGEDWERKVFQFLKEWFNDSDKIILNTSGSTGQPKEIAFNKQQLIKSAQTSINYFELTNYNTALLCLPAEYVAAKLMIVRAIVGQLNLIITEPSGNPIRNLSRQIDFCAMVPMQVLTALIENPINFQHIKKLIIGGQKITPQILQHKQLLPSATWETYGMTETLTHVALKKITPSTQESFKALPGNSFSVDDRDCLIIDNKNIAADSIITNDIVDLKSNTEFEYIGRDDNVVNSGGVKIFIENLEQKISSLILSPFAIASIPDSKLGERLVLVIEKASNIDLLLGQINKLDLAKHEIPKQIISIEKIPLTASGKVNRKLLHGKIIDN